MKTCVAKRVSKKLHLMLLVGACLVWSVLPADSIVEAAPSITAHYAQSSGSQLVIEINSGSNPPTSIILIQRFPPNTRMLNSQPGASNYNATKNRAKWLLRNLRSGTTEVSVTLDREVQPGEVSAEIRYKPQQGGKMTTIRVEN